MQIITYIRTRQHMRILQTLAFALVVGALVGLAGRHVYAAVKFQTESVVEFVRGE
jgi:hypothetical protein